VALHELPQHGSLPWGAVLQEQAAPAWFLHRVKSPASKPALAWAPLSTGLQVLAGTCSSMGLLMGSQFPSGIHLLQLGDPSMGYKLISAPPWISMDCRWNNLPHHGLHHELQGKALCSDISDTSSPPPSSLTLVSAELFLSLRLTPLSNCCLTAEGFFFPCLS